MTPQEFKTWRKSHGLTQMKCAAILGVSRDTIIRHEDGSQRIKRPMELATMAISAGLHITKIPDLGITIPAGG